MEKKSYVSLTLGVISIIMLFVGFYMVFFPAVDTVSELKESVSDISIPTFHINVLEQRGILSARASHNNLGCIIANLRLLVDLTPNGSGPEGI